MATDKIDTSKLPQYLILFLYIITGSLSNFGAIDILAPQWIYLGLINILSCIYFLSNKKVNLLKSNLPLLKSNYLKFYLFYILWNGLSYFYAINPAETLINLPRVLNTFFAIYFCYCLLYDLPNKLYFISRLFLFFFVAELLAYYNDFNTVFPTEGLRVILIKGFAGNKNITAASMAFKIPFVLYLIHTSKSKLFRFFLSLTLLLGLLSISLIEARAAILSSIIVFILFLLFQSYLITKENNKLHLFISNFSFIIIPYILSFLLNVIITTSAKKGTLGDTVGRIAFTEKSSNGRFQYWSDAFDYVSKNPLLASGLGNWKIASIWEGKEHITGYTVPYHAHNDFIHVFTETGILGGISYIGLFVLLALYILITIFKKYSQKNHIELKSFILILPLIVYAIDAGLNFPVARPLMQSSFAIFSALILSLYLEKNKNPIHNNIFIQKGLMTLSLLLLIPSLIVHIISFNSLKKQGRLLYEFNNATYNMSLKDLEEISHTFPNLTETAMPIKSMKARYYYLNNQKQEAYRLAEAGINDNPNILFSENLLSLFYFQDGNYDKAYEYAKKAFEGLPNNMPHYDMMMKVCAVLKKYDEIDSTFEKMLDIQYAEDNLKLIWTIYIRSLAQTRGVGDPHALNRAIEAYNLFPKDTSLSLYYRLLTYGETTVSAAAAAYQKGTELYNSKNFTEAAEYFKTAVDFDAIEKIYPLNAGFAYFEAKDYTNAIRYFDLVLSARHNEDLIERALRYKAISQYNLEQKGKACALFLKLKDKYPSRMHIQEFQKYCLGIRNGD